VRRRSRSQGQSKTKKESPGIENSTTHKVIHRNKMRITGRA
jgi:hypothetical protein